ncbi:MSMEG_6728 family protein [Lentzea sp. NPDC051838]|uniref:MSMEG_6728 family protein n=1 Tax=Lentzea sp. NPDC051838 TaxID=3154849 RepID=UPI003438E306
MQTFLPYADFTATARVLDRSRLGKQRVETLQVQRALVVPGHGWRHHPAVRMWSGYEEALVRYGLEVCAVWRAAGFLDTCEATLRSDLARAKDITVVRTQDELAEAGALPCWLGDPEVHRSHQSALVRKDPEHYRRYFPDVPDDLPYVWPPTLTRTVNPSSSRPMDT